MNFRSVAQLSDRVLAWSKTLPPDIDVVVGIPRSGLLVASLLSLYRNLPLTDVDGLLAGRCLAVGSTKADAFGDDPRESFLDTPRTVLVVDDSVFSGASIREARGQIEAAGLTHRVHYGAVYVKPGHEGDVDFVGEVLTTPRIFEWNLLNSSNLASACLDMDGVLCHDPTVDENDDGERYVEFLKTARPLLIPTSKIGWIVTSRIERYRAETEAWLRRHSIEYGELIMLGYPDGATRRQFGIHSAYKAEAYLRTDARLFVESSVRQSVEIARMTGRDVLCIDTMQMVRPGSQPLLRSPPPLADASRATTARLIDLPKAVARRLLPARFRSQLRRLVPS